MSVADDYRLLLAAYPARLRRRHGAELITTMLEMSGGRPTPADRRLLLLDGLRERFRLPGAGRPVALVAAVLALLVGGALGAAAGAGAGSLSYADLPPGNALADRVLGAGDDRSVSETRYYLTLLEARPAGTDAATTAERMRERLTAGGWTTTAPRQEADGIHFRATGGGVDLSVWAYDFPHVQIAGWPSRPASFVPLTAGGALLGMLAGWLLASSLTHRIAAARRRRRSAVVAGAGLALLLVPSAFFLMSLAWYLGTAEPGGTGGLLHSNFGRLTYGLSEDLRMRLELHSTMGDGGFHAVLAVAGLAGLVVAAVLARPRTTPTATDAAAV